MFRHIYFSKFPLHFYQCGVSPGAPVGLFDVDWIGAGIVGRPVWWDSPAGGTSVGWGVGRGANPWVGQRPGSSHMYLSNGGEGW